MSVRRGSMRLVLSVVVPAAAVCGGVAVACGASDGGSAVIGDDGGATTTTGCEAGAGENDGDAAVFMAGNDAGCAVKYAGPHRGTVAESVPRPGASGGIRWQSPRNALAVDCAYAHADLDVGQESELLRVTGYGFDLPPTATIKGVVVELKRQGKNEIVDGNIELWLDGVPSSRPKMFASGWPLTVGTHHYGQEVDTWGDDLTPALVGKPGFGTEIWARRREDAGTGAAPADVESLIITVWYCE